MATARQNTVDPAVPAILGVGNLGRLLDKYSAPPNGMPRAYLLELLNALMTTGKVRVSFESHTERLQLLQPSHITTQTVALQLFDEYLVNSQANKITAPSNARLLTARVPKIVREANGSARRAFASP